MEKETIRALYMCINEEEIAYEIPELEGQDVMEQQENSE
jgi:hypothetical protein